MEKHTIYSVIVLITLLVTCILMNTKMWIMDTQRVFAVIVVIGTILMCIVTETLPNLTQVWQFFHNIFGPP